MTGGREIQTRDNTSGGWGWIVDSLRVIFHLIGRLSYEVHHITLHMELGDDNTTDALPAWQQDASSPLHTANTHMCRYIYNNQSWCFHQYRPLHFPLFVLICDITGIRDTEILCTGSGVTDTTLETLHNPNINMTPSTPSTAAL